MSKKVESAKSGTIIVAAQVTIGASGAVTTVAAGDDAVNCALSDTNLYTFTIASHILRGAYAIIPFFSSAIASADTTTDTVAWIPSVKAISVSAGTVTMRFCSDTGAADEPASGDTINALFVIHRAPDRVGFE